MSPPQQRRCILMRLGNLFDDREQPMLSMEDVSPRTDLCDRGDLDGLGDVLAGPSVDGWHWNSAMTSAPRNSLCFKPANVITRCEAHSIASKQTAIVSACRAVG